MLKDMSAINQLLNQKQAMSFFPAVNLILKHCDKAIGPGNAGPMSKEAIIFQANPSLGYPVRDVEQVQLLEDINTGLPKVRMTVNFLGLYGPSSPLPSHYTEAILFDDKENSDMRRFLDVFNHRFISFAYRCWEKYRYPLHYRNGATDKTSSYLLSLIGMGNNSIDKYSTLDRERLIPLIGLIGLKTGNASVLKKVIAIYFGLSDISIKQFIVRDICIDKLQLNKLGKENSGLGISLSLGKKIKDCVGKFRVCLGTLKLSEYITFIPGGKNHQPLKELVRLCTGSSLHFDIELLLRHKERPECVISMDKKVELGKSMWLGEETGKNISVVVN